MPNLTYEELARIKRKEYERGYKEGQEAKVKEVEESFDDKIEGEINTKSI